MKRRGRSFHITTSVSKQLSFLRIFLIIVEFVASIWVVLNAADDDDVAVVGFELFLLSQQLGAAPQTRTRIVSGKLDAVAAFRSQPFAFRSASVALF